MRDRGEITFSAATHGWIDYLVVPLVLLILRDHFRHARPWSIQTFDLPTSPALILVLILSGCSLAYGLIRWKTFVTVGDGWVEVKSPFARRRFELKGAKLDYSPISSLLHGSVLVQADGKRCFLPLPTRADKKPKQRFAFYWLLRERGVDLRTDAISQFDGPEGRAEGVSYDVVGAWKRIVPGLTGFCLMGAPELVWFAAGQKPLLPLWINWLIFACGLALAGGDLFYHRDTAKPLPKNGFVIAERTVTLRKDGCDLWTADFADLRVEVSRSLGNLNKETLFKVFAQGAELRLPDKFDHWRFDGEDAAFSLLRLGALVEISDEVWEMNR